MRRILIADPLAEPGLRVFEEAGVHIHLLTAEERPRLHELLGDYDALVVRSMTRVDADLLRAGKRLKVVGRAGIGVDNVDIQSATEMGILVVNAPTANLVSAIEHTFALMLSLSRNVSAADASVKAGEWERKRFQGAELQGKTLGIVGFGRIGQRVAIRARAFEMDIVAYDPFLDPSVARRMEVEMCDLDGVLSRSDIVTLHTPLTDETRNLLNADRFSQMKEGALLVNCGRGGVVDEPAMLAALESGRLGGAALDVYSEEPPSDLTLVRHPRVVSTPHIGAQTREAQVRVATETAEMILAALDGSLAITAVNLPFRPAGPRGEPFLDLGQRLGRMASCLLPGSLQRLQIDLWGVDDDLRVPITVAVINGALKPFLGEAVNFVNAERIADGRGIEVIRATHNQTGEYAHLVGVSASGEGGQVELQGTLFGESDARVVGFEGYRLEFRPGGRLLVIQNQDVPGVVGKFGTLLGEAGLNIAEIHLARQRGKSTAVAVVRLDEAPSAELVSRFEALPEVSQIQLVDLESP